MIGRTDRKFEIFQMSFFFCVLLSISLEMCKYAVISHCFLSGLIFFELIMSVCKYFICSDIL